MDVTARIREFADSQEIALEEGAREGELVLTLPGEHKLKTVCSVIVGTQDVAVSAFVIRRPDENHEAVYRYLLQRNLRLRGVAYAVDTSGDVYLVGRVPLEGFDADRVFGAVLDATDAPFDELLRLGFLTSMQREWDWRVKRGESLRNLEAFADVLDPERH